MDEVILWIIRIWFLVVLGLLYGWGLGMLCCPHRTLAFLFRLQRGWTLERPKAWEGLEERFPEQMFLRLRIMGLITMISTSFVVLMWIRMGIFAILFRF